MKQILILAILTCTTNLWAQDSDNSELAFAAEINYTVTCGDQATYKEDLKAEFGPDILSAFEDPTGNVDDRRAFSQNLLVASEKEVRDIISKEVEAAFGFAPIALAMLCTTVELKAADYAKSCVNDKTGQQMSTATLLKVCDEFKTQQ
jgi:hypothetical protein